MYAAAMALYLVEYPAGTGEKEAAQLRRCLDVREVRWAKDSEILRTEALAAAFGQAVEDPRVTLARLGFAMEILPELEERVRDELRRASERWRKDGKVILGIRPR